jgi:hypothetical protein
MDEAGMTDSTAMHAVLTTVREARAKLVLVGDPDQLQPIGPGASFRALLERLGFSELQTIYRQQHAWQREATVAFAAGNIDKGLARYDQENCIHIEKAPNDAINSLVNNWVAMRNQNTKDLSQFLVVAHRNVDVSMLNLALRQKRIERGEIKNGHDVFTKSGALLVSEGDRLLFLKNNNQLGVKNGRFGTVTQVVVGESGNVLSLSVKLDGDSKDCIQINPKDYADFTHGYAATVHKVQGITVDHSFVYAGGAGWNRSLTYVAMTRHRHSCHLYASRDEHQNIQNLGKSLSRFALKDSLLDYPLAFANRHGIDVTATTATISKKLSSRLNEFKQRIAERFEKWVDPTTYWHKKSKDLQEDEKNKKTLLRREDARHVAVYVDANQRCGIAWKSVQEKMMTLGVDEIRFGTPEFTLLTQTQEYQLLQQSSLERDKLAAHIAKEPLRYEKALTRYAISMDKLAKQADSFHRREALARYQQLSTSGKTVLRDRLAMMCMTDTKRNYRYIKEAGLDIKEIRLHAIAHAKRQHMMRLSASERADFRKVETYQTTMRCIGKLVGELQTIKDKTSPDFSTISQHLKQLSIKRNKMAHELYHQAERFNTGLNFFQIGIATPLFGLEKPTQELMKQAEKRWYQMQDYAAKHSYFETVNQYQSALENEHLTDRFNLSREIVKEPRLHHPAVLETGAEWKTIRLDAKHAEAKARFAEFSCEERSLLRLVKKYQRVNRQVGKSWSSLLNAENKKFSAPLNKRELSQLLLAKRNYLAAQLIDKKSLCEISAAFDGKDESAGLACLKNHSRINFEKIEKQAKKHEDKIQQLHTWQDLYDNSIDSLSRLVKRDSIEHRPQFQIVDKYLK